MFSEPIYDPARSYYENFDHGPFGDFANSVIVQQHEKPAEKFLDFPVHLPFGIPAGPLLNGKFVAAALDKGFDLPVYKTVRTHRYPCHPWPNVLAVEVAGDLTSANNHLVARDDYREPLSITNSFGVPSFDPDFWQPDLAAAVVHAREGQVVIGSYQGTKSEDGSVAAYMEDFALGARLLKETGVKVVEVNLSCPNEGTSALLCFDIPRARKVVETIKQEIGDLPLLIKTAFFEDAARLEEFVRELGPIVQGICSINTISAEVVDESGQQALPGEGRLWSGVCGHSIKWAGLEMSRRLSQLRETLGLAYSIIGVGGVSCAADYRQYREAGADAVMAATSAMWNPMLAAEIKAELAGGTR
jgi:dihydroorotate dehydrogenase